jgi:hypothetical protein
MMFLPAGRFLTIPFPPGRPPVFAPLFARFFAAVILPPLLIFAILSPPDVFILWITLSDMLSSNKPYYYHYYCNNQ